MAEAKKSDGENAFAHFMSEAPPRFCAVEKNWEKAWDQNYVMDRKWWTWSSPDFSPQLRDKIWEGPGDKAKLTVKQIEKRDAVLTSAQQIDRLLKPGSKYLNLNPYEVLMIDPDTPADVIRKAYRKLSFLVHPDKNADDRERAQEAFEAVNKAYKMLEDEEQVQYCQGVLEEAKATLEQKLKEKRKQAKREGRDTIEEDDPEKYSQALRSATAKLFADLEIKKKHLEDRDQSERKRQREQEEEEATKTKKEKEWKQQWESTRIDRVDSWRSFQQKGSKKKKTKGFSGGLKPPKLKQEKRT